MRRQSEAHDALERTPEPSREAEASDGMLEVTAQQRDSGLDRLRGLAIILMVIDHVLVVVLANVASEPWMEAIRLTLTRLSMPLFMILSGLLLARRGYPSRKRILQILVAAALLNLLLNQVEVGLVTPEILAVWLTLLPFFPLIARYPVEAAGLGILQLRNLPIAWDGYQPGEAAAFIALGVVLNRISDSALLRHAIAIPRWCEAVGRRPLLWYVGHLTILVAAGAAITNL
ncbi:acyltransferase family protein [Micromonospora sagamiensis]|nr:acyltransferase family protein [Micromonospora sagamiensis]